MNQSSAIVTNAKSSIVAEMNESESSSLLSRKLRLRDEDQIDGGNGLDATSVIQPSICNPTKYSSLRYTHTLGFNVALAEYTSGVHEVSNLAAIRQFMQQENERWKIGQPLLLNISVVYVNDMHVLEFIVRYFDTPRTDSHHDIRDLVSKYDSYFRHQLQVEYQPSQHRGNSLLIRLARAFSYISNRTCAIGKFRREWVLALRQNLRVRASKDDQGNSILAQMIKNNLGVDVEAVLMDVDDTLNLLDSIFDHNHAGESVKDILMANSPACRTLAEQMHRDWYQTSRKYIRSFLNHHIISDISDLSLDYIDGGSKPENSTKSVEI